MKGDRRGDPKGRRVPGARPAEAGSDSVLLYAALACAGMALPLILIAHLSLWDDELFSVYFAAQGPAYIVHYGWANETNPPLYYLVLWLWMELFNRSETAVHVLSLLAHVATLPVIAAIAWRLGLRRSLWPALILFEFSAAAVQYAVMARMYSMWVLVIAIAVLALVSAVQALQDPSRDTVRRCLKAGGVFATAGVVALYVHDTTIFFVAAADATFLAAWCWHRDRSYRALGAWIGPQIVGLAAAAPQLVVIIHQAHAANIAWIPPLSPYYTTAVIFDLFGGRPYPLALLRTAVVAVELGVLLGFTPVAIKRRSPIVTMIVLALSGFALLCLASLFRPVLLARTSLWLLVPLALVVAAAIDELPRWLPHRPAFLAVAGLFAANAAFGTWQSTLEPWREFVKVVAAKRQPSDVIVVMRSAPITAFLYYFPASASWDFRRWDLPGSVSGPLTTARVLEDKVFPAKATNLGEIVSFLRQGRAVWLVSRLPSQFALHNMFYSRPTPGAVAPIRLQERSLLITRVPPAAR